MDNVVIAVARPWSLKYAQDFKKAYKDTLTVNIFDRDGLSYDNLKKLNPRYVFFPHWSWYIPKNIYETFDCIVFHPSDVPYGRGGSPIQNLIAIGKTETIISAIKVVKDIDAGDIYLKRRLSLEGGGEEILLRASDIIFNDMIPFIISNEIVPTRQEGEIVSFSRRTPAMSELKPDMPISELFNTIRMLDIEGYPKAFIKYGEYTLTFSRPCLKSEGILADVTIAKGEDI